MLEPFINLYSQDFKTLARTSESRCVLEITQKLSLSEESTQRILNSWKPWQIIKIGISSDPNLKASHLELNVGENNQNEQSGLSLRGMLSIN